MEPLFPPIKKVFIRSQASEVLHRYILDNGLKRGDRLPSERVLAEMLSIGRNTLREALRKLEAMGVVEVINGKGTYVREAYDSTLNLQIESARVNFLELLDIRQVLENYVAELVIERATEEDFAGIETRLARLEAACREGLDAEEEDTGFHHALYRACRNQTLFDLIRPMAATFHELWKPFDQAGIIQKAVRETLPLHRELYNALKGRDAVSARQIINRIFKMNRASIPNQLQK